MMKERTCAARVTEAGVCEQGGSVEVVVIGRKGVFQKQQLIQPLGHRMQLVDQGLLAFGELAHAAFPTAMCFPSNAARNASAPASPIIERSITRSSSEP